MELKKTSPLLFLPRMNKYIIVVFAIVLILTGIRAAQLYTYIFEANVKTPGSIIIPRKATYDQVCDSLKKHEIISDYKAFHWVAKKKKYPVNIKAGHYTFKSGMGTNQIVNMLISGTQSPVKLTFNNIRMVENLAGAVSKYIEADSASLVAYLTREETIRKYGFNKQTFRCMFIPNTYEFYWTTTTEKFVDRMWAEYKSFWNENRKGKAAAIGLSPEEVATVASIVQEETAKADERARVAGLYLNRIKRGMPLQADPTVKYALGDFSIRRVLIAHLAVDSPYNTYKNRGLPPGPINFPEISNVEAVLNAEKHQYLFMCAKEDFSGYHNFARTLAEHSQNASRYQQALNRNNIFK